MKFRGTLLAGVASVVLVGSAAPALAQSDPTTRQRLDDIETQLKRQAIQIANQEARLTEQEALIQSQALELRSLRAEREHMMASMRAGAAAAASGAPPSIQAAAGPRRNIPGAVQVAQIGPLQDEDVTPTRPVGQAPPEEPQRRIREVAAVPEGVGVLSRPGQITIDPSVDYTRTSSNRLVFRGVEIVPGIQLGLLEANDADRDTLGGAVAVRYGVNNRLEVEGRLPYIYRQDRITTVAQRDAAVSRTKRLDGQDLGDIELSARYQINRGLKGWPVFVANARVKPPTGKGPYDVEYDSFGVATELATGSGFWSYSAGLTMIYPTDPAVIFASLSYGYNAPKSIDKVFGSGDSAVRVGSVDPGDSIGLSVGFGLALNPRFSVSLGYSHTYIFQTDTDIGPADQSTAPFTARSNALQVGSMLLGWSYRLNDRLTFSNNYEFGVTSDASDMRMVIRVPYRF